MPVQGLGVEETALAVAAPERRCGRTGVLGVSTASTSAIVPLGRLGGAAGAHLAPFPRSRSGASRVGAGDAAWRAGRGCPVLRAAPLPPRRAAPRGCRCVEQASRTAGGAAALLPRHELLGEETRQIVTPIFAVEFWFLRAPGGVARTLPARPPGPREPWRVQRVSGFACAFWRAKLHIRSSPRRRGDSLADAVQGKEQPLGCPGTALPKAAHLDSVSPAHPPPTARRRRARSDARGGDARRRRAPRSHGLLLLAQERW